MSFANFCNFTKLCNGEAAAPPRRRRGPASAAGAGAAAAVQRPGGAAHTRTQLYAQVSTRIYHFACERDYLLFIPWDSSCRLVAEKAGAALPRMTTVPCEPQTQAGPTS